MTVPVLKHERRGKGGNALQSGSETLGKADSQSGIGKDCPVQLRPQLNVGPWGPGQVGDEDRRELVSKANEDLGSGSPRVFLLEGGCWVGQR